MRYQQVKGRLLSGSADGWDIQTLGLFRLE